MSDQRNSGGGSLLRAPQRIREIGSGVLGLWTTYTGWHGPISRVGRATPEPTQMPRYHFVVREPDFTHDDPEGVQLPNDDAARDEGQRIVRELQESGYDAGDAVLIVHDERGQTVHSIPF